MRAPPTLELLDKAIDWRSRTLEGPIPALGDCIFSHEERPCSMWVDTALPAHDGDLACFFIPARDEFNAKWLLAVDGTEWLACRYFAVRRSDWQVEKGRVVAMLSYPGWVNTVNPAESARIRAEMAGLRRNPPRRPDLVVFQQDPSCREEMRELIARHHMNTARECIPETLKPRLGSGDPRPATPARIVPTVLVCGSER